MVEREIEDVEIAQPPRGIDVAQRPVEQQRHRLLGNAAVRAQRRVEAGEVVARRLVPSTQSRSEVITTSPRRSGGSSKRAAAAARESTISMPGTAGKPAQMPATSAPAGR